MTARRHATTLALFTVLTIGHLWPLATAPGRWSRIDNADYALNAWILAWVVHQAPRDPVHLFDANIFYPERRTLAFSEHLAPEAVLAAPVVWAGGSAITAVNVTTMLGFVLSGWAMTAVITRWTGSWLAGIVAGSLLAFNAHTMSRLTHVQALHNYYLPLALAACDRLLSGRRWRDALSTGALLALQGLTSGYWLVFTAFSASAAVVVRANEWWPFRGGQRDAIAGRWRSLMLLAAAALLAAAIVTPFILPYWFARRDQGLTRHWQEIEFYAPRGAEFLSSPSRLHLATPLRWGYRSGKAMDELFPGVTGTLLTICAVATGLAWRDRRARMLLAIGVTGTLLSLGPSLPPYRWMYDHIALLQGIRAPTRFGFLALVAVAGLSGFAVSRLAGRLHRTWAVAVPVVICIAVNVEALRAPLAFKEYSRPSPVYRIVAQLPDAVVAEFPLYPPRDFWKNADYMVWSTVHWKPLVNGYSGFEPLSYKTLSRQMRRFPDPPTTDILRRAGVTHVIVHRNRFGAGRDLLLARLNASDEFAAVAADENVHLYRLRPR
jgi:hypothetical protein